MACLFRGWIAGVRRGSDSPGGLIRGQFPVPAPCSTLRRCCRTGCAAAGAGRTPLGAPAVPGGISSPTGSQLTPQCPGSSGQVPSTRESTPERSRWRFPRRVWSPAEVLLRAGPHFHRRAGNKSPILLLMFAADTGARQSSKQGRGASSPQPSTGQSKPPYFIPQLGVRAGNKQCRLFLPN